MPIGIIADLFISYRIVELALNRNPYTQKCGCLRTDMPYDIAFSAWEKRLEAGLVDSLVAICFQSIASRPFTGHDWMFGKNTVRMLQGTKECRSWVTFHHSDNIWTRSKGFLGPIG